MNLAHSSFRAEDVESRGMGAGVLPFAVLPNGELRILLGRERFMASWKGSCRWSGFEGSRKPGESLVEAALRECSEESLAVVAQDLTAARLTEERRYWIRVVLRIVNDRSLERYHSTWVVRVPWDETLPKRFRDTRAEMEHIDGLVQEWRYLCPERLAPEAGVIAAGPVCPQEDGSVRVERRVRAGGDAAPPAATTTAETTTTTTLTGRICLPCQDGDAAAASAAHPADDDGSGVLVLHGREATMALSWQKVRERLERAVAKYAGPGITARRDPTWNLLHEVHVEKDYLEKDQIRWWTEAELRKVLEQRGTHGTDRFRPYFLPILQTVLHEVALDPPRDCVPHAAAAAAATPSSPS